MRHEKGPGKARLFAWSDPRKGRWAWRLEYEGRIRERMGTVPPATDPGVLQRHCVKSVRSALEAGCPLEVFHYPPGLASAADCLIGKVSADNLVEWHCTDDESPGMADLKARFD